MLPLPFFRRIATLGLMLAACSATSSSHAWAQQAAAQKTVSPPKPIARLIWQDRETKSLKWANFMRSPGQISLGEVHSVEGFPILDQERQELVQMERIGQSILVGVRDDDEGQFQSGYVILDTGVEEISHGDHFDYNYLPAPTVKTILVNEQQGNPAHLYVFDEQFYLANDRLNGFTKFNPKGFKQNSTTDGISFHRGGGGHITLAAIDNKIAYSSWIAGSGPTKGQVDVVDLSKTGEDSIRYSFALPHGGIHGAIANSGKAFFAPTHGVYWVPVDYQFSGTADTVKPQFLSLGDHAEGERPYRTGSFTSQLNYVMFNTGRGDQSAFCIVDAAKESPVLVKVTIPVEGEMSLVSPETVKTAWGKRYAFIFQNQSSGEAQEQLTIIDLDPDLNKDFSDAKVVKSIPVGSSQVEGHYGHHSISFDHKATYAFFTNPGSGEIWVLSLKTLEVVGKYPVGGTPTKIIGTGGRNYH